MSPSILKEMAMTVRKQFPHGNNTLIRVILAVTIPLLVAAVTAATSSAWKSKAPQASFDSLTREINYRRVARDEQVSRIESKIDSINSRLVQVLCGEKTLRGCR